MAIVPNTDVNLAGNIRDVLNAAGGSVTNDVITFFQTRANINMWAKYKPVRHTKKFDLTDGEFQDARYGLNIPQAGNSNFGGTGYGRMNYPQAENISLLDFRILRAITLMLFLLLRSPFRLIFMSTTTIVAWFI